MTDTMTRAEAILEARRMMAEGDFMRSVSGTSPCDLYWDDVFLDCGHVTQCEGDAKPPERVRCRQCAMAWVDERTGTKLVHR